MVWETIAGAAAGELFGSIFGGKDKSAQRAAEQNAALQREFAQNGIRWRVEDAKAAGVHPLAALGMQPATASPTFVGAISDRDSWRSMGNDIGRAVAATATGAERQQQTLNDLAVERAGLENELLRSQIARSNSAQIGPPLPGVGGGDPNFNPQPFEPVIGAQGANHREPGPIVEYGFAKTPNGYSPVMSDDFKQRAEDSVFAEIPWFIRNNLVPTFGGTKSKPPREWLPAGAIDWKYNPVYSEYRPVYKRARRRVGGYYVE